MSVTLNNTKASPVILVDNQTLPVFNGFTATDSGPLSDTETVSITLTQAPTGGSFFPGESNLGTISDPNGGGTFNSGTFTESGLVGGTPDFATTLLSRLDYNAPVIPQGTGFAVDAIVTVTDGANSVSQSVVLAEVTPPAITGTVANEPIAAGNSIRPFASVKIADDVFGYDNVSVNPTSFLYNPQDTATITVSDGGTPTDADGLLTGVGLSKTGTGTYSLAGAFPFNLASELSRLSFQTVAGQTSNPTFTLAVTDPNSALTTTDTTTSLLVIGPPPVPVAPLIAGTQANQTVAMGNTIDPFASVTVSDVNANPTDSATITLSNAANGTFTPESFLTASGNGVYSIAATTPTQLTADLNMLSFNPSATGTTGFTLAVTDPTANLTATDTNTSVTETAVTPPTSNFLVHDETTGVVTNSAGEPYTGPVAGLTNDIILATTDNINVNAEIPNTFIKTGSGEDAIDVSAVNGNNVLDGSTGSNFLFGGTGNDTFFTDLRGAAGPTWDTIAGFHAGDAITVWGVTPSDFTISMADNQGATGFTGLTIDFSAAGQPDAKVTLAGFTQADLSAGRLAISYGTSPDSPGLPGSAYMQIS